MKNYALIDLHMHLDGSLPAETAAALAKAQGIPLPADPMALAAALTVPAQCRDLNEYLRCFNLPLELMQTREALSLSAESLLRLLEGEGLLYAEFRFAPQLHTAKGLTQDQAVEAVLEGLRRAGGRTAARVILCAMRGGTRAQNEETIRVAAGFLGRGVCAADLAGAEALYPAKGYADLFALAARLGVPFTIHAGEAAGPDSIRAALDLGARRIGHGVRAREDERVVRMLAERGIPLEMCPTSNLQTRAVESAAGYPLREYLAAGIPVTLCTDNRTVSGVTLRSEFALLFRENGLTEDEARALAVNAAHAAFLTEPEKRGLQDEIENALGGTKEEAYG